MQAACAGAACSALEGLAMEFVALHSNVRNRHDASRYLFVYLFRFAPHRCHAK